MIATPSRQHPPKTSPRRSRSRLRFEGRKRVNDAGEFMAAIVAKRLVRYLERSGFVVMKRPPIGGGAALGRGHEGR